MTFLYENFPPFFFTLTNNFSKILSPRIPSAGLIPIPSCEAIKLRYALPTCAGGMLLLQPEILELSSNKNVYKISGGNGKL